MSLSDFLAPLRRKKFTVLMVFIFLFSFCFGSLFLVPTVEKTTIYFSLKPLTTDSDTYVLSNGIEEGSKVAETIAGWAKNPAFREDVQKDAEVDIDNFKRKLSAQKQNRLNVFWTLKLYGKETQYSDRIRDALMKNLEQNVSDFNANNAFPFGYSQPAIFSENLIFPLSWKIAISLFFAFFFSFLGFFLSGAWNGRLLFSSTLKNISPESPLLKISDPIGKHDEKMLEHFINSFKTPKLISAFGDAEKSFSIEHIDSVNFENHTPIILVRLWDTKIEDIENFKAIFGKDIPMILFEQ